MAADLPSLPGVVLAALMLSLGLTPTRAHKDAFANLLPPPESASDNCREARCAS